MPFFALPVLVMAGISTIVGLYHLYIYTRRPQLWEHLTFVVLCFSNVAYDITCLGLYTAHSVETGLPWLLRQNLALSLWSVVFLWFSAVYSGKRISWHEIVIWVGFGCCAIGGIINHDLMWPDTPNIKIIEVPIFGKITYFEATTGPLTNAMYLLGLFMFILAATTAIRYARTGPAQRAYPLLGAVVLIIAGAGNDMAVASGLYRFPYLFEYAFMAMILLMASSLAYEVVRAGVIEQTLHETEDKYRTVVDLTHTGFAMLDPAGLVCDANDEYVCMVGGASVQDVLGQPMATWVAATDVPAFKQLLADCLTHDAPVTAEVTFCHATGARVSLEIYATSIMVASSARLLLLCRDISERKQTQAQLLQLRSAIEQSAEGVLVTDASGVIAYLNPAFEVLTGATREPALGRALAEFAAEQSSAASWQQLQAAISEKTPQNHNLSFTDPAGAIIQVSMITSPLIAADGLLAGHVALLRDETMQRRLSEQLNHTERMEAVGRLAGGIAHDLNNMLTPILAYSEHLSSAEMPAEKVQTYSQTIHRSAVRARDMVAQLVTLASAHPASMTVLNFGAVVENFTPMMQSALREHTNLVIDIACDHCAMRGDAVQLERIFLNMVLNAQDAMPDGGTLTLRVAMVTITRQNAYRYPGISHGDYVLVTFADTGVGIPPQILPYIFEPFITTKGQGKGTGLGLATTYGIVEQHQGKIWVESTVGVGTTFTVVFPKVVMEAPIALRTEAPVTIRRTGQTILLVEDSEDTRLLCLELLTTHGYRVIHACDGRDALAKFAQREDAIDLLITDVIMPGMNGYDLYKQLSQLQPGLPVLFMSAYAGNVIGRFLTPDDGKHFIAKPFTVHDLLQKVQQNLYADENALASPQ
ncbi:MAG TPA: PAS domain S-box protein [Armatimonadota bacterium]